MGFVDNRGIANYIGMGITFPLTLENGRPPIKTGFDLIRSSIIMITQWPYGTKFFNGDFGSRMEDLLQEPADRITEGLVYSYIVDTIAKWEPRVELLNANVTLDEIDNAGGKFLVSLSYLLKNTQKSDNFVFPYFTDIKH